MAIPSISSPASEWTPQRPPVTKRFPAHVARALVTALLQGYSPEAANVARPVIEHALDVAASITKQTVVAGPKRLSADEAEALLERAGYEHPGFGSIDALVSYASRLDHAQRTGEVA